MVISRLAKLSAVCLVVGGCASGGAHIIERTSSAPTTRTTPETAVQPSTAFDIHTPPDFPKNYRGRIAAAVAFEYLRFATGAPEITAPKSAVGLLGSSTAVCIRFPKKRAPLHVEGLDYDHLYISVYAHRAVGTLGNVEFKKRMRPGTKCDGDFGPYPELVQVGQRARDCVARGERRCEIYSEANRRDTLVLPDDIVRRNQ